MADQEIILYHYSYSPYARRIVWYLALRGIPYRQCLQPPMLPRPDVSLLGISYRRIPILSIGRDVYLDTRLQLKKLEALYPSLPRLGATSPDQLAMQQLLSLYMIDGGIFARAAQLIPTNFDLLKDPAWKKDRADFSGGRYSTEAMDRGRPESLGEVAQAFALLETTLLADGREWLLKTEAPGLADIEAVWPLHWLVGMKGALPADRFSPATYPKVYAWIERFQAAVSSGKKKVPRVSGEEAANAIGSAGFSEAEGGVDAEDPVVKALELARGDVVTVWPTDTGAAHKDVGKLMSLDGEELVIEVASGARVHAPRHGFRIRKGGEGQKL